MNRPRLRYTRGEFMALLLIVASLPAVIFLIVALAIGGGGR